MAKSDHLGDFEVMVLTALIVLGENKAYGLRIFDEVNTLCSGHRSVSLGAVYITLDRLERKGFCTSWHSDPTAERGGKMKRFYRVTAAGSKALNTSLKIAVNMLRELREVGAWQGNE